MKNWNSLGEDRLDRLEAAKGLARGKIVPQSLAGQLLERVIKPGDRVCIEGDNQKQADFLALALSMVDPEKIHDLHMVQSVVALPEHLDLFEKGIAKKLDFAFSG
ncbi:MAG TPA: malonate decarboxylase subunit alpha, partial [Chroococcales cyanobacterium]